MLLFASGFSPQTWAGEVSGPTHDPRGPGPLLLRHGGLVHPPLRHRAPDLPGADAVFCFSSWGRDLTGSTTTDASVGSMIFLMFEGNEAKVFHMAGGWTVAKELGVSTDFT